MQHRNSISVAAVAAAGVVVLALGCSNDPAPQSPSAGAKGSVKVACKDHPVKGHAVPEITGDNLNGSAPIAVKPGKVTIVDFWATWCKPCKASFPAYQSLYTKYHSSGLEIVALSVDEPDAVGDIPGFIKDHGDVKFPIGWDNGRPVASCFNVETMPTAYVIDKKGIVRSVHSGFHDDELPALEKEIKALL